jgi:hypothetical protein
MPGRSTVGFRTWAPLITINRSCGPMSASVVRHSLYEHRRCHVDVRVARPDPPGLGGAKGADGGAAQVASANGMVNRSRTGQALVGSKHPPRRVNARRSTRWHCRSATTASRNLTPTAMIFRYRSTCSGSSPRAASLPPPPRSGRGTPSPSRRHDSVSPSSLPSGSITMADPPTHYCGSPPPGHTLPGRPILALTERNSL